MNELERTALESTELERASVAGSAGSDWGLLLLTMVLSGLAGGMAWGIRGQYGHETGAMMFGVLVGLTLVMLFMPRGSVLKGARAVGLLTLAIGFGGSMSYGQTVGLTMDGGVHGNIGDPHWNGGAYWWGMLGLGVKGGLWIGFGGAFLGMGLGAKRYRPKEMMWLGLGMMGLFVLGRWLLNTPFDPDLRKLPPIYFSDHWRWEPAENVNPRPEVWGGLLVAFAGLMAYLTLLKGDRLGRNLGLWGIIGGLGFPIGQSLQAATAWDGATFQKNSYWQVGVNTWNLMEVTFGTVAGLALGIGLWCNRRAIAQDDDGEVSLSTEAEGWLIGSYTYLLCMSWYFGDTIFVLIQYHGLLMGILPMIAIVGGRYSALLYTFPVIAIPITFKTFLAICGSAEFEAKSIGLIAIVTVPLALLTAIALEWGKPSGDRRSARTFASEGLLLTSALYFWMNFSFFSFPWGWWSDWQGLLGQRQSGGIYIVAWVVLSLAAVQFWLKDRQQPATGR